MALPERLYYSLDKAVKKINDDLKTDIDIDDLLHFASIGKLELCFQFKYSNYKYHNESEFKILPSINFISACNDDIQEINGLLNFYYKQTALAYLYTDFGRFALIADAKDSVEFGPFIGNRIIDANMLLAIPTLIIPKLTSSPLDKGIETNLSSIPRTTAIRFDGYPNEIKLNEIIVTSPRLHITLDKLFITNKELEILKNSVELVPTQKHNKNHVDNTVSTHGNTEANAAKREQILLAAQYVKHHYPDECKSKKGVETISAWATAVENHSHLFWNEAQTPSHKVVKDVISDMYRLPKDRTRAGRINTL